jgi:hypothetical protein
MRRLLIRIGRSPVSMVVVFGLLTCACASSTQNSTPSPTPTLPPPNAAMPPVVNDHGAVRNGPLAPGTYTSFNLDKAGFNVRITVPAGWTWNGRHLSKGGIGPPDGAAIFFYGGRVQVYADPCHWAGTQPNPLTGASVRDLVTALAAQPTRSATTPSYHSANSEGLANGWAGMAVKLTVPNDINFADCDQGEFRSWGSGPKTRSHQGPGQRDLVWAANLVGMNVKGGMNVNYDGQRVIIDAATFPNTPNKAISETEAILRSIVVGHWG